MFIVGLSDVSGSWKTIPISLPRTARISSSVIEVSSWPARRIEPPTIWPPWGRRRIIELATMVLPHPDSPTTPSVSPGSTLKADAIDRFHHPGAQLYFRAEVFYFQEAHRGIALLIAPGGVLRSCRAGHRR